MIRWLDALISGFPNSLNWVATRHSTVLQLASFIDIKPVQKKMGLKVGEEGRCDMRSFFELQLDIGFETRQ